MGTTVVQRGVIEFASLRNAWQTHLIRAPAINYLKGENFLLQYLSGPDPTKYFPHSGLEQS